MTIGTAHYKQPGREARIVAYKLKNPDVTLTDIASLFSVSQATVSRALIKAGLRTYREKGTNGRKVD